jgi:excisionase family DNA binding protein
MDTLNPMPLLFSRKRTAATLGVSVRTVDYLIESRQLPTRRIGRRILIPYSAILRFVRNDHPNLLPPSEDQDEG